MSRSVFVTLNPISRIDPQRALVPRDRLHPEIRTSTPPRRALGRAGNLVYPPTPYDVIYPPTVYVKPDSDRDAMRCATNWLHQGMGRGTGPAGINGSLPTNPSI